jgi:hypothetical protein
MSWKTKNSTMYPLRIKNSQRYKLEMVAASKGRKLSEHIHWLISASINNYEIEYGEIYITAKKEDNE